MWNIKQKQKSNPLRSISGQVNTHHKSWSQWEFWQPQPVHCSMRPDPDVTMPSLKGWDQNCLHTEAIALEDGLCTACAAASYLWGACAASCHDKRGHVAAGPGPPHGQWVAAGRMKLCATNAVARAKRCFCWQQKPALIYINNIILGIWPHSIASSTEGIHFEIISNLTGTVHVKP